MGKKDDRLLTTAQAMEILGVNWGTIYSYISENKLKAYKLGGNGKSRRHWRIWYSDLVAFVEGKEGEEEHTESTEENDKSVMASSSPLSKE